MYLQYRFFSMMGTVFGFVSSDVSSKINILEEFRRNKMDSDQFGTFRQMLTHEKEAGLLTKTDYVSGSRTLLRLHRGLGKWAFLYTYNIKSSASKYRIFQISFSHSSPISNASNRPTKRPHAVKPPTTERWPTSIPG